MLVQTGSQLPIQVPSHHPTSLSLILWACQDGGRSLLCRGHTCILTWLCCPIVLPLRLKMLSDCWLKRIVPGADAHSAVKHILK